MMQQMHGFKFRSKQALQSATNNPLVLVSGDQLKKLHITRALDPITTYKSLFSVQPQRKRQVLHLLSEKRSLLPPKKSKKKRNMPVALMIPFYSYTNFELVKDTCLHILSCRFLDFLKVVIIHKLRFWDVDSAKVDHNLLS